MSFTVLIPDRLRFPVDIESSVFPTDTTFITPCAMNADEIADDDWQRADALLCWHDIPITAQIVAKLDRAKVIVRYGVGVDSIDLTSAIGRSIMVCNVPDYGTGDVADHASALLISLLRGIPRYEAAAKLANWNWETGANLKRISDCRIGIIGFGRIGTSVALRLKAFGARISFYDPYKEDGYDKAIGADRLRSLHELLEHCDAISLHTPLTTETAGMVNSQFVAAMSPNSILVNTARGGLVDLDALYFGLASGHIASVGLDVLPEEPPDPEHPLIRAWKGIGNPDLAGRIVVTPHCAFYNQQSYSEMRRKASEEALRVLLGEHPHNRVA